MIPKIVERKIVKSVKSIEGSKYSQYTITLPKEYALELERKGIQSLLIIFDFGLGAFPRQESLTEDALRTFMNKHPELQQLFAASTNQQEASGDSKGLRRHLAPIEVECRG